MRLGFDRFTVVLDACALFPAFTRDVLLTLADHGFYNPKWSVKIHAEWTAILSLAFGQEGAPTTRAYRLTPYVARWIGHFRTR